MPIKSVIENATGGREKSGDAQSPVSYISSKDDEDIAKIVEQLKVTVKVVGCGGGGSNTINRCMREGIFGAELIAANTDAKHLLSIAANRKILLGRRTTRGLGAGAIPQVGEESTRESEGDIASVLGAPEITFITAGMGGGTGTGGAHIIAGIAKREKSLVISIVTLPFSSEGSVRMENALYGLEKLRKNSDTTIVIPNDKLLKLVPRLPLDEAFKVADQILMEAIKGLTEIITKPGLVNIDYSDIRTIMSGGGVAMIGIGESGMTGQNRVEEAVHKAIYSPLIDADISDAKGVLVRIVGDETMTVSEAEAAVRLVHEKVNQNARIIWGASVDNSMEGRLKVLVVLTGVKSPYMLGTTGETSETLKALGLKGLDWGVDQV